MIKVFQSVVNKSQRKIGPFIQKKKGERETENNKASHKDISVNISVSQLKTQIEKEIHTINNLSTNTESGTRASCPVALSQNVNPNPNIESNNNVITGADKGSRQSTETLTKPASPETRARAGQGAPGANKRTITPTVPDKREKRVTANSPKHKKVIEGERMKSPASLNKNKEWTYTSSNLTKNKSLTSRIKEGEISIATSDKSNRFLVSKRSQYIETGLKHNRGDRVESQDDIKRIQTILNSHTRWFSDTFNMGAYWNHQDRMTKNITENGEQTCHLTCLVKDHKGWVYSEETPIPPSRPVISGNVGINRSLSELLSLVIEPITADMGGDAIESTSDMLNKIEEINQSQDFFFLI